MFTEIRATNFKSWARLAPDGSASGLAHINSPGLSLGKVTGLFGANSSGKTSILQVPLLLKQTAESADRRSPLDLGNARSPIRLGTFRNILRDHDTSTSLGFGLSWEVGEPVRFIDSGSGQIGVFADGVLAFDTEVISRGDVMEVNRFRYWAGNNEISCQRGSGSPAAYTVDGTIDDATRLLRRTSGSDAKVMAPVKCYGFPETYSSSPQAGIFRDLEFSLEEAVRRIYYLGPLRDAPQPTYTWSGAPTADVGFNGAAAIQALLTAQLGGYRQNFRVRSNSNMSRGPIGVEQHVAEWLQELGLVHSFRVDPIQQDTNIYRVYVRRFQSSPEVLLTDIGFGVSQVLPVLVLLAYAPEGSTVILEQPEIHLHPAVQSSLADVILEAALVRNVQVLVESHSEHLLKRIQLRVAEQKLTSGTPVSVDDVRLWFIDQQDSVSQAKDLKINEYGEIVNWPPNFFGNPLEETAKMVKEGLRRRRNSAGS